MTVRVREYIRQRIMPPDFQPRRTDAPRGFCTLCKTAIWDGIFGGFVTEDSREHTHREPWGITDRDLGCP